MADTDILIRFPERNRGRKRKSCSMDAAGLLSLLLLDREGEPAPDNVKRIDNLDETGLPPRSVERMLLLLIFSALPAKKRESIKRLARCAAYGQDADAVAVELHNLLKRHP